MGRGGSQHSSMDAWMGHRPGRRGQKFLRDWKKKGHIDTFLSLTTPPAIVYMHQLPTRVPIEDRQTREKRVEVFSKDYTCHETEEVLEDQYRRDENGARERPPERCSLCKLGDFLYRACLEWFEASKPVKVDGKLTGKRSSKVGIDPCLRLFEFKSEDARSSDDTYLTAGGMCGILGGDKVPEKLAKHAGAMKVRFNEVWKEKMLASCKYAIPIVDNDAPDAGVQIAKETKALGMKVQDVLNKMLKSDDVSYARTPYCIRWEYKNEPQLAFDKKYDAYAVMKVKPSSQVMKLIKGEGPDLSPMLTPFNQTTLRAVLEKACLHPELIPWDALFPTKEQEERWAKEDAAAKAESAEDAPKRGKGKPVAEEEEGEEDGEDGEDDDESEDEDEDEEDGEEEEMFECDNEACKAPVRASDKECPKCGTKFEVEEEHKEEPKDPPPRKRSEAKKEGAKAKAGAAKKEFGAAPEEDDGGIPF